MSETILVVDDEPSNRKILAQKLVHRGYAIDTAQGGKDVPLIIMATAYGSADRAA